MEHVTDIAAKRAELSPERVAFHDVETGQDLTFTQVNDAATRLASGLRRLGVAAGERIGILCHNRSEFFVLLFACQKLGAVLVPLNWRQPPAELSPIIALAKITMLFCDAAHHAVGEALAGSHTLTLVALEASDSASETYAALAAAEADDQFAAVRRRAGDVWYLLFTSGTTGTPKAVIQTFAMAWVNAVNVGQAMNLATREATLNFLPLFHTAGINLITLPVFLAGGVSRVLRKFDPDAMLALIAQGRVSAFFGVPAIYQAFALHPQFAAADLSPVRSWSCGGAPLPEPLVRTFAARGVRVQNGYGMTETGPTVFLFDAARAGEKLTSVGRAQMLTEARIVDAAERPLVGPCTGEVQIRGPGVTPGYFENPQATAAAFTADGWLRTGDIARRDADGDYFIVDRIKDMFISGGENVYPAEVEHVLVAHADILEAAVIGVADPRWGEVGHAFVLARPGRDIDVGALPAWCRERLASYKIPKAFTVVPEFPRTAAGKIQKHVLKAQLP